MLLFLLRENLAAMQRAIKDFSVQIRPEGFPFLHFVFSVMKFIDIAQVILEIIIYIK